MKFFLKTRKRGNLSPNSSRYHQPLLFLPSPYVLRCNPPNFNRISLARPLFSSRNQGHNHGTMVMFGLSNVFLLAAIHQPICGVQLSQFTPSKNIRFVMRYHTSYNFLIFSNDHYIHAYQIFSGVSTTIVTVSILQYTYQLPITTQSGSRFSF